MTSSDGEDTGICPYCGMDYTDPNDIVPNEYARPMHKIMECDEVPEEHREELNKPGVQG